MNALIHPYVKMVFVLIRLDRIHVIVQMVMHLIMKHVFVSSFCNK